MSFVSDRQDEILTKIFLAPFQNEHKNENMANIILSAMRDESWSTLDLNGKISHLIELTSPEDETLREDRFTKVSLKLFELQERFPNGFPYDSKEETNNMQEDLQEDTSEQDTKQEEVHETNQETNEQQEMQVNQTQTNEEQSMDTSSDQSIEKKEIITEVKEPQLKQEAIQPIEDTDINTLVDTSDGTKKSAPCRVQ